MVDNGSRDGTASLAEERGVRVLRRPRGAGPGSARNAGAGAARARVLAFTDADCAPTPGWLAAACNALTQGDIVLGPIEPLRPPGPLERTVHVGVETGLFERVPTGVRARASSRP